MMIVADSGSRPNSEQLSGDSVGGTDGKGAWHLRFSHLLASLTTTTFREWHLPFCALDPNFKDGTTPAFPSQANDKFNLAIPDP